jgi:F-type H+-transporting ATPase subunit delta
MAQMLQSASRDALAEAADRLDSYIDSASASDLARLGDDLFAVLRLLSEEPGLRRALADPATPAAARSALADRLFNGKISRPALDLVSDLVSSRWSRTGDLLEALEVLARRDRYVAHVRTPVRLTAEQEQRLADSLSRLYNRPISLQVELDPSLLGGLVVQVGGELIDGSVSGKLAAARRRLPG